MAIDCNLTDVPRFILPSPYLVGAFANNFDLIVEHALVTLYEILLGLPLELHLASLPLCSLNLARSEIFSETCVIFSQAIPVCARTGAPFGLAME